jgi:putative transposase
MYPTVKQQSVLKQWMGTARFVYNKCLSLVKDGIEKPNFYSIRNKVVTRKNNPDINEWEFETPKDIRASAVKDLVNGYKGNFAKLKNRSINYFTMKYRSRKKESAIELPPTAIKLGTNNTKVELYPTYNLGQIRLGKDKCLHGLEINHACRLAYENAKWYLHVPVNVKVVDKVPDREFCALDPGVCNFQTVYSEEQTLKVEVQKELFIKLQSKMDYFQSLRSKKLISKSRYIRKTRNVKRRLTNLVDDIHYKLIQFLTGSYQNIFLPTFESQELVQKMRGRRARRNLLSLRHSVFKQRLKAKCSLMKYSQVYDCTEEYTSKTCGRCGKLNTELGFSRVFECPSCNLIIDRDINGARNIAIKILKD